MKAKASNLPIYFLMFRVRKYPSAIIKAKIGKANLPTFVIQCWPVKIVAHKWSNSMNPIARTCRPKEVIPIFFVPRFINFFYSPFTRHHLNTAARKQVDPCFPVVHRLNYARVYHGEKIISTELDAQSVSGGAHVPIRRFLDRKKVWRFLAQPKDYGKPSDAGLLFANQPIL